jgi:hypothetical protein
VTALMEPPVIPEAPTAPTAPTAPVTLRTIEVIPPCDDDSRATWNPTNGAGVEEAAALYEKYRAQGYTAYEPMEGGGGAVIHDFDPTVDIHLLAPLAGG